MVEEEVEVISSEQIPALVPRTEKVVNFYGDNVPVAQTDDDKLYVPLRPLTRFLGISFGSQVTASFATRYFAAS